MVVQSPNYLQLAIFRPLSIVCIHNAIAEHYKSTQIHLSATHAHNSYVVVNYHGWHLNGINGPLMCLSLYLCKPLSSI